MRERFFFLLYFNHEKGENGLMAKRFCPLSSRCGGCDYINERYEDELLEKYMTEEKFLSRFCHVSPILPSPEITGYRCKVQAVCGEKDGKLVTGIYRRGTHKLIPVKSCILEDERATEILAAVRTLANRYHIRAYDEDRMTGDLRHVLIRTSRYYDEALVVLVASDSNLKSASDLAAALHQRLPYVKSVSIIVNREKTSMVIPDGAEEKVIYGKGYIMDRLSGLDFRISSKSFFQINPHQAERLYTIAMNMADLREDDTVIDAYCGTGTIALIAAHVSGCRVIGVESNPEAVRDAEANARLNGLDNVSFITADASKYMKEMAKKGEHCSVLFLDPPRSGASEEFLAAAGRMAPERIVYISCNPETLGRDLRYIHRFMPYKTRGIQPVDLFPASAHIETAVFLDRY